MATTPLMTIDDLENLSGHDRYELLRGKLHEMSPPTESHSDAHLELTLQIARFAQAHDLRKVFIETAFVFERSPDTLLIPDIAFVRELRLPADRDPQARIRSPRTWRSRSCLRPIAARWSQRGRDNTSPSAYSWSGSLTREIAR